MTETCDSMVRLKTGPRCMVVLRVAALTDLPEDSTVIMVRLRSHVPPSLQKLCSTAMLKLYSESTLLLYGYNYVFPPGSPHGGRGPPGYGGPPDRYPGPPHGGPSGPGAPMGMIGGRGDPRDDPRGGPRLDDPRGGPPRGDQRGDPRDPRNQRMPQPMTGPRPVRALHDSHFMFCTHIVLINS